MVLNPGLFMAPTKKARSLLFRKLDLFGYMEQSFLCMAADKLFALLLFERVRAMGKAQHS